MNTHLKNTVEAKPPRVALKQAYAMLALVLLTAIAAVAIVAMVTHQRIAESEHAWFIARLNTLVPPATYDNDLFVDRIEVLAPDLLGTLQPTQVFRARRAGQPKAVVMRAIANDGYGGQIHLLVAADYEGKLLGVDVIKHNETPGIGDVFEPHRSNWLQRLTGRSLNHPPPKQWTIHKDGGEFDQFTGASVTPRAILKAVRHALEYYATHRDMLFNKPSIERDQIEHL